MNYGAIEAGGTKFVCAVSDESLNIQERVSIPTLTPSETMKNVFEFFDQYDLNAIGVGSFGPIDINKSSETYGYITNTPKPAWAYYDFVGDLKKRYEIPVAWTTDVNAAAYGEIKLGAAKGLNSCVYITVGTGIGGGAVVNGELLEGYGHPEMGHILVRRHKDDDYAGNCPFHIDCLEGLAAGPAIEKRTGKKGQDLPENHITWEIEAYYLAQAIMSYTLILSPEKIILGGGVMHTKDLVDKIRKSYETIMIDYVKTPTVKDYIVPCGLEDNAGITGCLLLGIKEYKIYKEFY